MCVCLLKGYFLRKMMFAVVKESVRTRTYSTNPTWLFLSLRVIESDKKPFLTRSRKLIIFPTNITSDASVRVHCATYIGT